MTDKFLADQISVYHNPGKREDTNEAHTEAVEDSQENPYSEITIDIAEGVVRIDPHKSVHTYEIEEQGEVNQVSVDPVQEDTWGQTVNEERSLHDILSEAIAEKAEQEWQDFLHARTPAYKKGHEVRMRSNAISFGELTARDYGFKIFTRSPVGKDPITGEKVYSLWTELEEVYQIIRIDVNTFSYAKRDDFGSEVSFGCMDECFMIRDIRGEGMFGFEKVEDEDAV